MRGIVLVGAVGIGVVVLATAIRAGEGRSCTGAGYVPRCDASWEEKKTKKPVYEIRREYACDRGRDPWHAPDPECRCQPPCGKVYVKKRLYVSEGREHVEQVPKYEVEVVPAGPCGCTDCAGGRQAGWDLLKLLSPFHHR